MKQLHECTTPEEEAELIEQYRRMTAAEKMQIVAELNRAEKQRLYDDVKRRYPDATDYECRLRVASHSIPADLMRKAFGWDPEKEGY